MGSTQIGRLGRLMKSVARVFRLRLARGLTTLAFLVVGGVVGYVVLEGWSLLDSAYMVVVTFTTVGYAEVNPLSQEGRLFTMALMVAGVGVMFYTLTGMVQLVVEQEVLRSIVRRHRMRSQLSRLKGHFIVCGFGRVGRAVAGTLQEESVPLIIVDTDERALADAQEEGYLYVQGDSTKDADLTAAHVQDARGLVAATGDDAENVYISLTARGLNPELHIVARASSADAEDKLRRAGADQVVSPYDIGGRHMALTAIESEREARKEG